MLQRLCQSFLAQCFVQKLRRNVVTMAVVDSTAMGSEVEITVVSFTGEQITVVSLPGDSTILEFKRKLTTCGHLVEEQQLSCGELALKDDKKTLTQFGLEGKVTVTLVLKGLNVDMHIETLRAKGSMTEADDINILCAFAREIFLNEPSLLELQPPLVIAANLVGCAHQLNYIFDTCGEPPGSQYLFLGNYVSRGCNSIDTIGLLLLYKKKYPQKVHVLRGRQECASISRIYGFYDECKRKFSIRTWKTFIEVFNSMPFCALIQERILCVPSGLSPYLQSIDQLRTIHRPDDVPDDGLVCDLLWSYFDANVTGWVEPDKAVEWEFGPDVLQKFLEDNHLERIYCSSRIMMEGYESLHGDRMVSLFSASNYCGEFDNKGAVLVLDEQLEHKLAIHDIPWSP